MNFRKKKLQYHPEDPKKIIRSKSGFIKFEIRELGNCWILKCIGDLIGERDGPELIEEVNSRGILYDFGIVDMEQVRYINSAGIGILITLFTKFRNKGGELILLSPSEHVTRLLELTKLKAFFSVEESFSSAKVKYDLRIGNDSEAMMGLTLINGKLSCVSLSKEDGQFKVVETSSEKIFDILRTYRSYSSSVKEKIEEFEYLINKRNIREQELHLFFEKNPDFLLFNDNYHKLRSKIVLESNEGNLIPDFVLEPYDDYYSDIVELKLPAKKVFSGTNKNRIKYSQNVAEGIAQLRTYSNYFQDSNNRNIIKSKYDIEIYKPTMYLIIGRTTDLDPTIKKDINYELQGNYEIISYDQILNRYDRKYR